MNTYYLRGIRDSHRYLSSTEGSERAEPRRGVCLFLVTIGFLLSGGWGFLAQFPQEKAEAAASLQPANALANSVGKCSHDQYSLHGAVLIPPPAAAEVISHGLRTKKKIALTFDACSTRKPSHYDERVTKVLVETKTPATLFLGGKWIEDEEEHARYLASLPQFELGNHTYIHPHLTQISSNDIRAELKRTEQAILRVAGRNAALFRPPYGDYDERVGKVASEAGLTTVMYDLASGDPDIHATKEKLVEYVTSKARNGSIIVMHINRRGWHTAEALPDIISILRKRGFTFVTVGELLRDLKRSR